MVIKKIFEGIFDEEVHTAFLKYGKGEYSNKYLVEAKKQKGNYVIKTSSEYANYFVETCLKNQGKIKISGIIVTTLNLGNDEELGFKVEKRGNFQGIKKLQINTEVEASKILALIKKYPRVFFALSFKTEKSELKIKAKAPKSGKPGKDSDEVKADFCSLKTSDPSIIKEVLFDIKDFKEVRAEHKLKINEIIYPKDSSLNPAEIREKSKRKGVVFRKIILDGNEKISESNFLA